MKREKWESNTSNGFILVFIIATIVLVVTGIFYLKNEEAVWSKNALKQLKNASVLKTRQVETWRQERLADAREIAQSPLLQDAVYNWINHQENQRLKNEIQQSLNLVLQSKPDYVNILLADTTGRTLLAANSGKFDLETAGISRLFRQVAENKKEIFGDLFKSRLDGAVYTDIAWPIHDHEIHAVLLFKLNPQIRLFPILQSWTYDSTTEESFLFEARGDSVLFLSSLKSRPDAELSLKVPLTSKKNPAAMAILNGPGFYEGIGYHGQRVMEYIQPITGSSWFLASKIDRDELFQPVHTRVKTLALILSLLFISLSTSLYLIINYRRKHFYRQLLEDERQQAALKSHYEYVVKFANDIILLEDENLNIIEANQRAQNTYQFSLEELRKMKITDLVAPEIKPLFEARLKNVVENNGAIVESIHQRKDGSLFYVEVSARMIKVDGRDFLHQIIRDITERKQAEIALIESEEQFRTTLYSTGDAIITTDTNGKIRYMNPVAEELTGWKEVEASGKPIREVFNIFSEDTREEVENPVDKVLEKGMIVMLSNHTFLLSKDGSEIPIGDSGAPIRNAEDQIAGVVLVFRDQTYERETQRKIRESEEKYRKAFQTSPDSVNINRLDGYYVDINEGFTNLTGFTREEVIGKLSSEIDIWAIPEDREKLVAGLKERGFVHNLESRFRCKDGSLKTALMSANLITLNYEPHILSITRDITELKRAEEEIKQNGVRLRSIVEILQHDTVNVQYFLDFALEQAIQLTSSQIGYIYHYNEEKKEFVLNSWSKDVMKECLVIEKQTIYQLDQTGIWGEAVRQRKPIMLNDFQAPHSLKKGHPEGHVPLRNFLTVPVFVHDKIVGVIGVANKATDYNEVDVLQLSLLTDSVWKVIDQKQAEDALRKSEENLSITLNSIGDAVIATDRDGLVVSMNPVAENLCGWKFAEAEGKPLSEIFKIINSETRETVDNPVKKVLENGDIVGLANHTVLISLNGIEYQIADSAAPIKNKEGEISGVVLVFSNVTEKYVAQKQLKESESFLKETQNIAHLGTYSLDIPTGNWTSSALLDEIFGIERNHDKSVHGWVSIIHPDWQETMNEYFIQDVIGKKIKFDKEYQILRKIDKEVRWVHGLGNIEYDKQLNPVRMIGTIQDITERKQAEVEQFRLLNIIEKSLNEIYVFDATTLKFEFINHGALENLGFSMEEMKKLTPVDIKPEFTEETFRQMIEPLKTGAKDNLIFETIHRRRNGSSYPVEIHLQLHKAENKSVFLAVINDITERLESIKTLHKNHERWENLFNNSPNAIAIYQAVDDGNDFMFTDFNLTAQKTDNLTRVEVVGKRISELFPSAEELGLLKVFRKVWHTGKTEYLSSTFYKDNRIEGWRENIIYKLGTGEIVAIYNDISVRMKAEMALRESEGRFKNIFSISPDAVSISEIETGKYIEVNESFERLTCYKREEIIGKSSGELGFWFDQKDRDAFVNTLKLDGYVDNSEVAFRVKEGRVVQTLISARIVEIADHPYLLAVTKDITERKNAEIKVRQSELKFKSLFENAADPILLVDFNGNILDANPATCSILGYSINELRNMKTIDLNTEEYKPKVKDRFETLVRKGDLYFETAHYAKNGSLFRFEIHSKVIEIEGKKTILSVYRDITIRKQAEEALRESEENFRNYFENSPLGKSITGMDGSLKVNQAFCQILGYSREELLHLNWKEITYPDDLQLSEAVLKSLVDGEKEIESFEKRYIHKNGDIVWTELSTIVQKDAEGRPSYFISSINNVTERKQAEKQLKLLGRAIDQNPVSIVITNTDGDVEYVNPKFTEVTGYTSEEVIGKNPRVLQSGDHSTEFYKELWDTILSGNDWHGEFHDKKKNGELYWENAVISPVFDLSGKISSFVAVKEDITEKKKTINDLIIAKEKAEESDRLKSAFLNTISHELRTPLNAVIGFSSLIDQELPIEQITSFAQIINNSGNNLLEIIEGIFDLALLESGETKLKQKQFELSVFMEKILDIAKAEQRNAGKQQIEIVYAKTINREPVLLHSDPNKLTQVFTNLLKNALKFTHTGKIEFGYVVRPNGNSDKIEFFVKDTGIGIPENQKSIIFDRFRMVDDSHTRLYGGTGIGLSISKKMVELLGGKIWVDSELRKGSTFYFTIPYLPAESTPGPIHPNPTTEWKEKSFSGKTILVAEDEESNFQLLKYLLVKLDLQILHAWDGQEAVEMCSAHPGISLVLMDIKMPRLNGLEATLKIKELNPKLPVIAQSAFALQVDIDRAIESGCDGYLVKPVNKEKLFTLLEKFFQ